MLSLEVHSALEDGLLDVVRLHGTMELSLSRAVSWVNDLPSVVIGHIYRSGQSTRAHVVERVDARSVHRAIVLRLACVSSKSLAFSVRKWSHMRTGWSCIVCQVRTNRRIDPRVLASSNVGPVNVDQTSMVLQRVVAQVIGIEPNLVEWLHIPAERRLSTIHVVLRLQLLHWIVVLLLSGQSLHLLSYTVHIDLQTPFLGQ